MTHWVRGTASAGTEDKPLSDTLAPQKHPVLLVWALQPRRAAQRRECVESRAHRSSARASRPAAFHGCVYGGRSHEERFHAFCRHSGVEPHFAVRRRVLVPPLVLHPAAGPPVPLCGRQAAWEARRTPAERGSPGPLTSASRPEPSLCSGARGPGAAPGATAAAAHAGYKLPPRVPGRQISLRLTSISRSGHREI